MLPETLATPLAALICPACGEDMELSGRTLQCTSGHRFDAARQGYFNFLTGRGTPFREDTAEMVQARVDFLSAGHYAPLTAAILNLLAGHGAGPQLVLDAGAGTGHYLQSVLAEYPGSAAIAVDISRYAMRRAAKLPRTVALVWDVWQPLPVAAGSADLVLNVFAPRNPAEFARVLAPGGMLVVVTPQPQHLQELAGTAGMLSMAEHKQERVSADFSSGFEQLEQRDLAFVLTLDRPAMAAAVLMGPAGHHVSPAVVTERISAIPEPLEATAAFGIQLFRRRRR